MLVNRHQVVGENRAPVCRKGQDFSNVFVQKRPCRRGGHYRQRKRRDDVGEINVISPVNVLILTKACCERYVSYPGRPEPNPVPSAVVEESERRYCSTQTVPRGHKTQLLVRVPFLNGGVCPTYRAPQVGKNPSEPAVDVEVAGSVDGRRILVKKIFSQAEGSVLVFHVRRGFLEGLCPAEDDPHDAPRWFEKNPPNHRFFTLRVDELGF